MFWTVSCSLRIPADILDQQVTGKHPDETNVQHNQLIRQPYNISDINQQRENRYLSEHGQSTLSRMQQQQNQFLDQQNDISNFHQQQLGQQHNVPDALQYSTHTMQQAKIMEGRHKTQYTPSVSFFSQGQRSQSQVSQQQVMSQLLTHQAQLQLGSQNKLNALQRDMNQRMHASSLPQNQSTIEHQRQLFQFQRRPSDASSNSLGPNAETNAVDRREAVHQKIKSMKEMYMPPLLSIQKKYINFLQNSRAQTTNSEQAERQRKCILWLESTLGMLTRPPCPELTKERLLPIERHIIDFIKFNRVRRNIFSQQPGQKEFHPSGAYSPRTQSPQLHHTDNQMNTLMQSNNFKNSVSLIQPNACLNFQHDSTPSLSSPLGGRAIQPSLLNTLQTRSDLDSIAGRSMSSLQQGALGSLEKILENATQQTQINISSQNDRNALQPNINFLQPNSNALQHQHPKQQFHQPQSSHHLKLGPFFHMSSPQHLQAASPCASQNYSPQTDQQSLISSSISKSGTPLQPASSPLFSLSPGTSAAPSPMLGDHGKQTSNISSHSNAANCGQGETVTSGPKWQSRVIGTPGISASPLLAEFASPDNNQGTASKIISGNTSETKKPIDRLIEVVKSMSHKALSASLGDIYSVVSMVDRIAVSKPGYDSKGAVGEDLVATVEHCIRANNFLLEDGIVTTRNVTVVSSDGTVIDSFKLSNGMETSDLESTATSTIKRPRVEDNLALVNEVKEINVRLVNTRVDISKEDMSLSREGTIVNCCFTCFTSTPNPTFPVVPICFLVPSDYPNCSPLVLDKLPLQLSKEAGDLVDKAKSRFSRSLCCLSHPMSLGDMARSWDTCARAVILEYCVQNGGGEFSTRYGHWETL